MGSDSGGDGEAAVEATSRVSQFVAGLRVQDLPPEVLKRGRWLLLDTLGCALGGATSELGSVALGLARISGGFPESTLLGAGERTGVLTAAAANGRMAGALDGDDTFPSAGQTSHHAISAVAAALALCERRGTGGGELLVSLLAGYEVAARFGIAVAPDPREAVPEQSTKWRVGGGPAGVLAAAAASARAIGLDAEGVAHTLGIAGAHVDAPPLKWLSAPVAPMVKSLDGGWNAATGVTSALMAQMGMTGHEAILDGEAGLWRATGYARFDPQVLVEGLGQRWRVLDGCFKRWPCQYWMQQPLTALWKLLREDPLPPREIERVILKTNPRSSSPRSRDKHPVGAVTCEFNLPHAAAMLAHGVPPGPRWYGRWALTSPEVAAFRERVEVEVEPAAQDVFAGIEDGMIKRLPASCEVRARGRSFTARAESALGTPWSPELALTEEDLKAKFREMADPLAEASNLWQERLESIMSAVLEVDRMPDVRQLGRLLAYPSPIA
ncbi:MAG TPA: MmgE/PrpD family protein [Candidatus Nitrosotalea sp.]|nr:MmgE/PrpD family protein [Candidatus Nitrosotalea sp.]